MTVDSLRSLINQASHLNPHLTSRLEKAAFIVLLRPVMKIAKDRYRVMSEDGLRWYEVRDGECDCYDYVRHGTGHPCKHRLAVTFRELLEDQATKPSSQEKDDSGYSQANTPIEEEAKPASKHDIYSIY